MAVRNIKTDQMKKQVDGIRRGGTASPVGHTSITRGGLRVASEEGLTVQGSQRVTGRLFVTGYEEVSGQLHITGSLVVSGNADVTGPMDVRGPLTVRGSTTFVGPLDVEGSTTFVGPLRIEGEVDVTGPFTVAGTMDITGDLTITGRSKFTGDLSIEGTTKLRGDMEVLGDGRIRVGSLIIGPALGTDGGFYSTSDLFLGAATLIDILANNSVDITTGDGVNIRGGGLRVIGMPEVTKDAAGYTPVMLHRATGQLVQVI